MKAGWCVLVCVYVFRHAVGADTYQAVDQHHCSTSAYTCQCSQGQAIEGPGLTHLPGVQHRSGVCCVNTPVLQFSGTDCMYRYHFNDHQAVNVHVHVQCTSSTSSCTSDIYESGLLCLGPTPSRAAMWASGGVRTAPAQCSTRNDVVNTHSPTLLFNQSLNYLTINDPGM